MDKCDLCFPHDNVKALCGMLMKSWAILAFDRLIVYSKHNASGDGCNYRFNNLLLVL
jgi:hypothetical protein